MVRRIIWLCSVLGAAVIYVFSGTDGAWMLLCASILLPLTGILIAVIAGGQVKVNLEPPSSTQKGVEAEGTLLVKNATIFPVVHLLLYLELENTLTREKTLLPLGLSLAPLEQKKLPFRFESAHCGRFRFCCTRLCVSDFFGLMHVSRNIAMKQKLTIPPELFPMRIRLTGGETLLGDEDSINFSRKGQDWSEPFQLREYTQGDSLKQIHWKLSQKLERYMVTDPSQTLDRALLVFWDRGSLGKDAPPEIPDTLAEAVTSMCLALTQDQVPFSVAWSLEGGNGCEVRDISSMDDLYAIIPQMLHTSSGTAGISGIPECVQTLGGRRYPLIAYFGDRVPAEIGGLTAIGKTSLFVCSQGAEIGDTGTLPCWPFSSVDYRQSLGDVTI